MHRLVFHHDKVSSHIAKLTMEYLEDWHEKYSITFLEKSDIPVKGPDISPLDFFLVSVT